MTFKIRFTTIPELGLHIGSIDYRRGIARAGEFVDALGNAKLISETFLACMAGAATDFTGGAEARVMKQFVTQLYFICCLRVVRGNRDFGQAQRGPLCAAGKGCQQIKAKVARIIDRVDKMPIEQIGKDLQATVHGAKKIVDSPELARAITNLDAALEEARLMIGDLRTSVTPQLNATLADARQAIANADGLLAPDSPMQDRLKSALDEIAKAARSLRQLMDYLERHPESIISGKGSDK